MKQTYLVYGKDCLEWMYEKDVAKIAQLGEFSSKNVFMYGYIFQVDSVTGLQWQIELQYMSTDDVHLLTTKQAIANDIWLVG